ncbi:MAG: hypothetical protein K9M45_07935 [Kiritimatiellales bacterium]|nr:hypothetical protein [Kiritimatiellales bacterium]
MQETALPATDSELTAHGYTKYLYKYYLLKMIKGIKSQMVHSQFFWHHNFIPMDNGSLLDKMLNELVLYEIVAGGPDILPYATLYPAINYPLYDKYRNDLPLFASAQNDSYRHLDNSNNLVSMQEIYDFAAGELHANYIVWSYYNDELPSENSFEDDAFPVIQANNPFNTNDVAVARVVYTNDLNALTLLDSNGTDPVSMPTHTTTNRYYSDGETSIFDAGSGNRQLHIESQTHTASRSRGFGVWIDSRYWGTGRYTLTFDVPTYTANSGTAYVDIRRGNWEDGGAIAANIRRQLSGETAFPEYTAPVHRNLLHFSAIM